MLLVRLLSPPISPSICTLTVDDTTVICMDAPDSAAAFGISLGHAHVIRDAGGSARDIIR